MKYLSICSGIEAASVAWHPLGWEPLAFSEIEPFPRAVLAHHYPGVPLHGDFTVLKGQPWIVDADVLVGGTPCQAFSVAGLRKSLDDDRGNLSLEFIKLADSIDAAREAQGRDPAIIVWENVPGVLSVKDNAFGCFLAALAGDVEPYVPPRGKWTNAGVVAGPQRQVAWRILDAQYFGLAQRRRRVFVVSSARDGFDPSQVLLEWESLRRDFAPSRETGKVAPTIPSRSTAGGGLGTDFDLDGGVIQAASTGDISHCLNAGGMGRQDYETETLVAHSLRGEGFDANGGGQMAVAFAQNTRDEVRLQGSDGQIVGALAAEPGMKQQSYVAVPLQEVGKRTGISTDDPRAGIGIGQDGDPMFTLQAGAQHGGAAEYYSHDYCHDRVYSTEGISPALNCSQEHQVRQHMAVRRLTPRECERLQGFPDDYTLIPWRGKPAEDCPDGPRYKALGNSMAVPCMRWIGQRITRHLKGET